MWKTLPGMITYHDHQYALVRFANGTYNCQLAEYWDWQEQGEYQITHYIILDEPWDMTMNHMPEPNRTVEVIIRSGEKITKDGAWVRMNQGLVAAWRYQSAGADAPAVSKDTKLAAKANKESIMLHVIGLAAMALGDNDLLDEIDGEGGQALAKALEAEKEERAQELGLALRKGLKTQRSIKDAKKVTIRDYRKFIDTLRGELDEIDRAFEHGKATGNWVPWFAALGESDYSLGLSRSTFEELRKF